VKTQERRTHLTRNRHLWWRH